MEKNTLTNGFVLQWQVNCIPQIRKKREKNPKQAYLDTENPYDFSAPKFQKAIKSPPSLDAISCPLRWQ